MSVSKYCYSCQAQRIYDKPKISHVLHLLLTLLTAGLWVIVWILIAVSAASSRATCTQCGQAWRRP